MPQYVSNECPKCGGGLPPENNKFQDCPYCGQSLVLKRSAAEVQEDIAQLKSEVRREEFDVRRENHELQREVQSSLTGRVGQNAEVRKLEALLEAQVRLKTAEIDRDARISAAEVHRDGIVGAARGRNIDATKQHFSNWLKMFFVEKAWGCLVLIVVVVALYIGGTWLWENWLSKVDLSRPTVNQAPANTTTVTGGSAATNRSSNGPATNDANNNTPTNSPVKPDDVGRAQPMEDRVYDLRARVRTMSAELSGKRYVTLALSGTVTWKGEELRFYLSGQAITVGDAMSYPIGDELSKRKQFTPALMKLDLYNMEGLMQSLTRRPELSAIKIEPGVSITAISKDGKIVTLSVDGKSCDVPFVENSEATTRLPK